MSLKSRLDKLESTNTSEPKVCVVWEGKDADAAVARFRKAQNWPDDGRHSVQVIRVNWQKASVLE